MDLFQEKIIDLNPLIAAFRYQGKQIITTNVTLLNNTPLSYHQATDEDLARNMVTGDRRAFSILYQRYGSRMHAYFHRMLGQDGNKAADFTQELFLKIIEKISTYNHSASLKTWIYTIAGNMVKNEYRRLGRQPQLFSLEVAQSLSTSQQSAELLDREILSRELARALQSLDETHRDCLVLRYLEELSIQDISDILQCPPGTVKSRIHYATKKLGSLLQTTFINSL